MLLNSNEISGSVLQSYPLNLRKYYEYPALNVQIVSGMSTLDKIQGLRETMDLGDHG